MENRSAALFGGHEWQTSMGQRSVCIFIPTLTAGGAERVASLLADHWCETRRVVVVTYFDVPPFFAIDPRVEIICLGLTPHRPALGRVLDVVRAALRFRRIIGRLRPAFVLSFMNKYNAFCLVALRGLRIPVIVSERGSPTEALPRIRVVARDMLYPSAAGLICQTRDGHDFITAQTRLRAATVIPNPVRRVIDPAERNPDKIILAVGRFVEGKGFDQLLVAMAAMSVPGWRLILCGDGPLRAALEQQARTLGIEDGVEFPGLVGDLAPYYRRAGIFAFPSLHEGFPNALAEAMVSGLPCVSHDCPTGPSDLIEDGESGLLIPVGDVAAMTAALDRLAAGRDFAERLGARAADLVERLDPAHVSGQYLAFCETAARQGTDA